LHELGFLHNDIKLENILIGRYDPQEIYLIDFGLSSSFLDKNCKHIKKKQLNYFSGNLLFASLSSCRGCNKSRRDDIESAFYILVYLLNDQTLPWSHFEARFEKSSHPEKKAIQHRLFKCYTRQIVNMIPAEMFECFKQIMRCRFDEVPKYNLILQSLQACFEKAVQQAD